MHGMREIVFDTETTGIMPGDGHRVVEIGALEMVGRVLTGKTFHTYIDPCRPMPKDSQAIHGLSSAFLTGQPVFEAVVDEFLAFIEDSPLVAHNAVFDFGFINYELKRCGMRIIPDTRAVCTLELSRKKHPGAKHTLDALCNRYGVDLSARTKHGALIDAELLARVYVELTGGRQIGFDLAAELVEDAAPVECTVHAARALAASEAELLRHAAFIATLKDPVSLS